MLHLFAWLWQNAKTFSAFPLEEMGFCHLLSPSSQTMMLFLLHFSLFFARILISSLFLFVFVFFFCWLFCFLRIQASFTGEDNPLEFTLENLFQFKPVCGGSGQQYAPLKRTLIKCRPV